jgi:heme exporter protein D
VSLALALWVPILAAAAVVWLVLAVLLVRGVLARRAAAADVLGAVARAAGLPEGAAPLLAGAPSPDRRVLLAAARRHGTFPGVFTRDGARRFDRARWWRYARALRRGRRLALARGRS